MLSTTITQNIAIWSNTELRTVLALLTQDPESARIMERTLRQHNGKGFQIVEQSLLWQCNHAMRGLITSFLSLPDLVSLQRTGRSIRQQTLPSLLDRQIRVFFSNGKLLAKTKKCFLPQTLVLEPSDFWTHLSGSRDLLLHRSVPDVCTTDVFPTIKKLTLDQVYCGKKLQGFLQVCPSLHTLAIQSTLFWDTNVKTLMMENVLPRQLSRLSLTPFRQRQRRGEDPKIMFCMLESNSDTYTALALTTPAKCEEVHPIHESLRDLTLTLMENDDGKMIMNHHLTPCNNLDKLCVAAALSDIPKRAATLWDALFSGNKLKSLTVVRTWSLPVVLNEFESYSAPFLASFRHLETLSLQDATFEAVCMMLHLVPQHLDTLEIKCETLTIDNLLKIVCMVKATHFHLSVKKIEKGNVHPTLDFIVNMRSFHLTVQNTQQVGPVVFYLSMLKGWNVFILDNGKSVHFRNLSFESNVRFYCTEMNPSLLSVLQLSRLDSVVVNGKTISTKLTAKIAMELYKYQPRKKRKTNVAIDLTQ
jgi:hypothetical protein